MTMRCGHTGGHIVPVRLREQFGLEPLPDECLHGGCADPAMYPDARIETIRAAREDPGYVQENVTPITAMDRDAIEEMWVELRARLPHEHGPYGRSGCAICRKVDADRAEAERVSARFPERSHERE